MLYVPFNIYSLTLYPLFYYRRLVDLSPCIDRLVWNLMTQIFPKRCVITEISSILNIEYMKTTTKPRPVLDWEQENRSELYLIAAISSKLSTEPMNEIDCEK